jgi:hypothetical protein
VNVRRLLTASFCLAAALVFATPARAADFTWFFTGSGASAGLGANVVFHDAGGGQLTIPLPNTGTADVTSPSQALTALLFNCNCGTLVPVSAFSSGAIVGSTPYPTNTNVGGEWAFGTQTNVGSTQVLTSMGGFNTLSPDSNSGPGNLGGSDLDGQAALNGVDFGIVPDGDDGLPNIGQNPDVIQHDVVFTFSGFNGNLSNVSNVSFQYGTSTSEFNAGGGTGSGGGSGQTLAPEPTSLLLFGSGLAMTAYRARRKKQQKYS